MAFHLFGDIFALVVEDETGPSGMMLGKSSHVEDVIVVHQEDFVVFGGIVLDLLLVFKLMKLLH